MTSKPTRTRGISDENFVRISSGNPQADEILGGGFPANSINIVMGQPGTGKTIFAEQLLFHNAGGGRSSLYTTTLSEPLSKVVTYVQRFSFFDADLLGGDIQYEDLGAALLEHGPNALIEWLEDAIKKRSPKIIVIDSFKAIHDLSKPKDSVRTFVSRLAGLLSAYDITAFLLGEYTQDDIGRCPEFAVADSIVEFARNALTARDERYFRVLKLRGSAYREGQHAFRISSDGIQLYPRLVAPRTPEDYGPLNERLPSGIPGLDRLMGGGMFAGSTTLLLGMTGAGKTTMGLQFAVEGVKRGERVMYVNFQENPAKLRRTIAALGADPETVEANGLKLVYASPVELQIDSIVVDLFEAIRKGDVKRLVIDAVGDLAAAASDSQRLYDYLYSLIQHFAVNGVTTLLTMETGEGLRPTLMADQRFSYMSDSVINLAWSQDNTGRRLIHIVKMRGSAHEHAVREFEISAEGAKVR